MVNQMLDMEMNLYLKLISEMGSLKLTTKFLNSLSQRTQKLSGSDTVYIFPGGICPDKTSEIFSSRIPL
jgi:hypothetical protein